MATMTTKLAKIDPLSEDTLLSSTDLFATESTYTPLMGGDYEKIAPIRTSNSGCLESIIRPSLKYSLDLLNTYMTVMVIVVKADGFNIPAATDVSIIPKY